MKDDHKNNFGTKTITKMKEKDHNDSFLGLNLCSYFFLG